MQQEQNNITNQQLSQYIVHIVLKHRLLVSEQ